jgi:hypothetical protein
MSTLELENIKHPDNSGDNIALASNGSITIDRKSTDGTIAEFRKDGTSVGSIGVGDNDNLYISGHAGSTKGLYFNDNTVGPVSNGYNISDNTTNLGAANARFKDAYLSGGVYLGGTGSANKLNDYEEGTWTPTHTSGNGTGSFSDARYTKIGNTVHMYFAFSFSNGGGSLGISGFPFNANGNSVGIGREDQTNGYGVYGRINSGDSTVYLYATQASSNASAYQVSNGAIKFAITYETNS